MPTEGESGRPRGECILILLFDMHTGVSGDMVLGALFDLGVDFAAWKRGLEPLGLPEMDMRVSRAPKHGLMASRFALDVPHEHAHRGLEDIRRMVDREGLPPRVRARAMAVFARLAEAEARVHGIAVDEVRFHEVGALDAIVDIVGACLGFEMLGAEEFLATPFAFGTGTASAAHGHLPVPVPAVTALTEGFPSRRTGLAGELTTPTGAAIVTALARPVAAESVLELVRAGYGAGSRDLPDRPNVLRLCLLRGEAAVAAEPGIPAFQVECNLDNMAPELIAYAAGRLFAAGCKDVWQEPVYMKKNRGAVKLCALAEADALDKALTVFAAETATGGVRWFPVRRLVADKSFAIADTSYGPVELKRVEFPGRAAARWSPEYESCRKLAEAAGAPLQDVYREALALAAGKVR